MQGVRLISIHAVYVHSQAVSLCNYCRHLKEKQFVDEVIRFEYNRILTSLHRTQRVDSHRFKFVNACVMRPTMASENDAEA